MKKILAMVISIALVATMAITGSIAYLQDTDEAVNVMTLGNVDIEQHEWQRNGTNPGTDSKWTDDELVAFEQDQGLYPMVLNGTGSGATVRDIWEINGYTVKGSVGIRNLDSVRNYTDKIVTVENTSTSDAYVRTIIAIPTGGWEYQVNASDEWLHWNGISDTDTTEANGWMWGVQDDAGNYIEWPGNTDTYDMVKGVVIDGIEYNLYVATNKNPLPGGEATAPCLVGFYVDSNVDNDGDQYFYKKPGQEPKEIKNMLDVDGNLTILVGTQAVQAEGFNDAWTALDAAFGDISRTNHPWIDRTDINAPKDVANAEDLTNAFANGGTYDVIESVSVEDTLANEGDLTLNLEDDTVIETDMILNTGDMTIEDGTVKGGNKGYLFFNPGGNATIDNVDFVADGGGVNAQAGSQVTFESGSVTINTTQTSQRHVFYAAGEGTVITVEDGEFAFEAYRQRSYACAQNNAIIYIKGGTFGAAPNHPRWTYPIYTTDGGQVIITGGTFGFNPSTWVADGYVATENNGVWTVAAA